MRRLIMALSTFLVCASPAMAGLDSGLKALKRGDYAAAIEELRPLADAGNDTAQFHMAEIHRQGLGTDQDFKAAAEWYQKAARSGHAAAQGTLGGLYASGIGVPQDFQLAYFWLIVSVVWSPSAHSLPPERLSLYAGRASTAGLSRYFYLTD